MAQECKCCKRVLHTRMEFCFDCVESESIIIDGLDMYDNQIPIIEGLTNGMSKLQYILKKYINQNK